MDNYVYVAVVARYKTQNTDIMGVFTEREDAENAIKPHRYQDDIDAFVSMILIDSVYADLDYPNIDY